VTHPAPPTTPTPPPWPGGPRCDDPAVYISPTAVEVRCADGTVVVAHEPAGPAMDQTAEEAIVAYLREAARLMREWANAATPGPWQRYGMTGVAATDGDVVGEQPIVCEDCGWRVAVTGCATDADAQHIASWHPGVTVIVADLMEAVADGAPERVVEISLTLARAYLEDAR